MLIKDRQRKLILIRVEKKHKGIIALLGEDLIMDIIGEGVKFFIEGASKDSGDSGVPKPFNIFRWANFGKKCWRQFEIVREAW
jgi:hypothetical protein